MLNRLYTWYGKKVVLTFFAIVALLIAFVAYSIITKEEKVETEEIKKAEVTIKRVSDISYQSGFTAVGTVQAVSEARLQTEAGGRVTSVQTEIGSPVRAGAILATIENASERAALLQAEGSYEAALASAQSSEAGLGGAEKNLSSALDFAIATYQSTHIAIDTLLHNDIDDLFSIENGIATGFKIDGKGQAPRLNTERTALESVITQWGANKSNVSPQSIAPAINKAKNDTERIVLFVEDVSAIVNDQDVDPSLTQAEKDAYEASLFSARTSLNASLQQLIASEAQIDTAKKALEQAQIAGADNAPSASSAQVKIALGSLRSAQANYEKTLVRTPISGVVNALYLKTSEYVTMSQQAAIVANNAGLEIVTSIGEDDRNKIAVGEEVTLDGVATGTITAIAGSIDPTTGKIAVKVSVDALSEVSNGSIVQIAFAQKEATTVSEIIVPLSAVKMTGNGPIAFTVSNESTLAASPLILGPVQGDSVVVKEGITFNSQIVIDARGLKEGQEVTIKNK